ncbi:tetratricopeptide repeat protein [Polyangium aurulentum]|uniref:tetratricopeptide repeat protein n=1 Tax=Polyangium aurulentum TaxID=2567896 RepID=UPI0010AEE2AA|nr:tetratricopeptide repeat protein [Polyangium aurulentum]UQA56775.1 tetratricopeptide repeat protein [Polyangium aurulentum]
MFEASRVFPVAACLALLGCSGPEGASERPIADVKVSATAPSSIMAIPAGAVSSTAAPAKKKRASGPAPDPEKLRDYRKHLAEGRRLAGASKWADAVKEIEQALAAIPGDAPALVELGWAAFNAGDTARARKANEEALRGTTSPKIKAMALYNLGRVAEAQKDPTRAREHYTRSLELRPSEAVEKRLAELEKRERSPKPVAGASAAPLPCQAPLSRVDDVCNCLGRPDPEDTGPRSCEALKEVKMPRDDLRILLVEAPPFRSFYWLVARNEKGWAPVASLGQTYNPGAFGIFEELDVVSVSEKTAGSSKVLWVETKKDRHDTDMGIDEYEEESFRVVTLCALPEGDRKSTSCPLQVPVEIRQKRERLGNPDFIPDEVTRPLMTKGLPLSTATDLAIELLPDGRVEVKVKSGTPSADLKPLLGIHALR